MNEEELKVENKILRTLLWKNHGCSCSALYGDDGELQCNQCMIDFKRDSVYEIEAKIYNKNMKDVVDTKTGIKFKIPK